MGARPVTWRYSKSPVSTAPAAITREVRRRSLGVRRLVVRRDRGRSPATSAATRPRCRPPAICRCQLETRRDAGVPYIYSLEGDVEDVSRQHIANRASVTVHPAPWYVGVRRPSLLPRTEDRPEDRGRRRRPRRHGRRRRSGGRHADADPVDERPARRRQRLLHVGHRAPRDPGGIVDGHDRRRAGAARHPVRRTAATTSSRRAAAATTAASR